MSHHNPDSQHYSIPTPDDERFVANVAESPFMRALLSLKEKHETVSDRLHELYDKGEDARDEYDALVDDTVYDLLSSNNEFTKNALAMRTANKDEQVEIRDRQRQIFSEYREHLVNYAGLPEGAGLDAFEKAKSEIAEKIKKHLESGGDTDNILGALGILVQDNDGNEQFTYPYGMFPASTDKKWETYLDSVRNHIRISRAVSAGTIDRHEGEHADEVRRYAHNAISKDVDIILGLGDLPDSRWRFEDTRKLLAKMRDHKFPTVETSEKGRTTREIIAGLDVVKALHTRISDLHK